MFFGIPWTEWLGYIASVIIMISFLTTSIVYLRLINLLGSLTFGVYAFLIHSPPTIFLNLMIAGVQIYYLIRLLTQARHFSVAQAKADDPYLQQFIAHHQADVDKHYPQFASTPQDNQIIYYYLDGVNVVGVYAGTWTDAETIRIDLDYVIPAYQDLKVGRYFYSPINAGKFFSGVRKMTAYSGSHHDDKYWQAMGFQPDSSSKSQGSWIYTV